MSLETFKKQVLLLHSEQRALDSLSTGFNDRYTIHCATSGSEALNTLGEIQIDVIVTAQNLPGMSGLEALREAKKRSPETIGILLAGKNDTDLEALVGDQEVFQVVRGSVTPDALRSLIDNATRQARLLALAESANDTSANPDEPMGEHIVMETSENGSSIISDGTGRLPLLDPKTVSAAADVGTQAVEVLVLTQDEEFLATVRESARGLHHVITANTLQQADDAVRKHKIGVAVIDAAIVGTEVETLTLHLRSVSARLVAIVAGRRDDGEMLMDLINRGKVYRFLLKPVSPGRSRLAIEASVRHHLEAPDSAFIKAGKPAPAPKLFAAETATPARKPEPAAAPKPAPKPVPKPTPKPKPVAKPSPKPVPKAAPTPADKPAPAANRAAPPKPRPAARPKPAPKPQPAATAEPAARKPAAAAQASAAMTDKPAPITASRDEALSPIDEGLGDAFGDDKGFGETVTDLVKSVGRSFSSRRDATPEPGPNLSIDDSGGSLFGNPKVLGIGALALVAVAGIGFWLFGGSEEPPATVRQPDPTPTVTEAEPASPPAAAEVPIELGPDIDVILADARDAAAAGRIVDPEGDNAIEYYLAARAALPGDPAVETEFATVVSNALGMAESALLERRYTDAERALRRVALADPQNTRLRFLDAQLAETRFRDYLDGARVAMRESRFEDARTAIDAARQLPVADTSQLDVVAEELAAALSEQQVDEVLARAAERLESGRLIAPSNDNARYFYELALSNDPDNATARQGLVTIASKLILSARAEIDANRFDAAANLIAEARRLDPSSSEVSAAASALQAAQERLARERRLAEQRATEQRLAAERAAAERAAAEKAAAERAAAEKAAAERLSVERLASQPPAAEPPASEPARTQARPVAQAVSRPAQPPAEADGTVAARTFPGREPQIPSGSTPPLPQPRPDSGAASTSVRDSAPVSASTLKRTKYAAPRYPRSAMRRNLTGWVDVVFTVDIDGTVSDVSIRASEPEDTFVDAATDAVSEWEFEPVIEDGVAIQKRAAVRMMFQLE